MIKLTLPEADQMRGDKKIEIFRKYGTKAAITDFARLLGGGISDETLKNSEELKDRTGWYWTKTNDGKSEVITINCFGASIWYNVDNCNIGCRPSLPFSSMPIENIKNVKKIDGVSRVEYGEYPQYAVSNVEQEMLEKLFLSNSLAVTGRSYTIGSRKLGENDKNFNPKKLLEYEYNGRKFVRIVNSFWRNPLLLSNGQEYKLGDAVWIEVTPVTWLIDKKDDIAVSERILVAGIQFNKERNYKGNFDKTDINNYMNTYLIKELDSSMTNSKVEYDNKYVAEVHRIIEEIKSNLKYYSGTKDINKEIEILVNEYNNKINMYNPQGISLENPNYLIIDLINKLSSINDSLKQSAKYKKEYVEILDYINRILKALDGTLDETNESDLLEDLKLIKDIIIPFLGENEQNKIADKIRQIVLNNKELVKGYIQEIENFNYKIESPKYKNKKEFELSLRKELHPILEELDLKVKSKDIKELTKKYMKDIELGSYEKHESGIINVYFNAIDDMIQSIKSKISYLDQKERKIYYDRLNEVTNIEIVNDVDLKQIVSILNNVIKNIYRIELDIDEKIELTQNLDNYKINL